VYVVNDGIRKEKCKLINEKDAGNPVSCSSESAHSIKSKELEGRKGDWQWKEEKGCSSEITDRSS
jgi:hypothetical protein